MDKRSQILFSVLAGCVLGCTLYTAEAWLSRPARRPAEGACTSFCLDDGGHAVVGANYDNEIWEGLLFVNKRGVAKTGYEAGTGGRYARWTARYGSVTFNLAGVQMVWAGMNEAGLVFSTMWLGETRDPAPDVRPPLVSPLWVQYQLDTAATLGEVMANDARVRIASAVDHYLVCDRTGACAAVEFTEGGTVFHTGDAMPVKALANHPYLTEAGEWQAGRLPAPERFRIAADRVTSFRPSDAAPAQAYAFETLRRLSGQALGSTPTQWSIVFDTENLRIHFRTSHNPEIRTVDFSRLDFGCGTPARMLDVHAPLSGDISDKLGEYAFETNLAYTLNFLNKHGNAGLSAFEVEVLERGVASFACEPQAVPYQDETTSTVSPVVGWAALALLYRYWPVLLVLGLGIAAWVTWRRRGASRARRQHR